jgi:lipoprotein-releasing system permease protein
MYRSFLSWRYLVSRPTNLIGIVGIMVGVGALILILSIMTGFLEESRRAVRGTLADVVVKPFKGEPTRAGSDGYPIVPRDPEALLKVVRADPRVASATPQLVWFGTFTQRGRGAQYKRILSDSNLSGMLGVQLVGVDVDGAGRLTSAVAGVAAALVGGAAPPYPFQDELDSPDFRHSLGGDDPSWTSAPVPPLFPFVPPPRRQLGRPKAGVLMGEQLFRNLGLRVGDEVEILTLVIEPGTEELRPVNREYAIAGTFRTGENETDLGRVYLDRRELVDLMGYTEIYSQVLVRLHDYARDAGPLVADLRGDLQRRGLIAGGAQLHFGAVEVKTWEEFRGSLLGAIENERILMGIMLGLVLLVAGFTIFAILSMMVTEKRRDIGILSALGAPPRGVLVLFLMIAFWDALLGASIGAVLGVWGALRIDAIERWISRTFSELASGFSGEPVHIEIFNREVYLFDTIPAIVQPVWVACIVLGAFLCALVFAAIPAWRAARLDPLQALRYE